MKFFFSKYVWIIGFVLLLLIIPFFFLQSSRTKTGLPVIPQAIPPLPIFHISVPTPIPTPPFTITEVAPNDKATDVPLNDPIAISFSRPLSQTEKVQVRLSLIPTASGSAVWSPDNTQLIFTPVSLLAPQASYSATVLFGNQSYNWTFTTSVQQSTTAPAQQQSRNIQATFDDQWAQIQKQLYQNFPWYDQLPLSTTDYFVSFDMQQNVLTADLFPKNPNNSSEINGIKQEVQNALKTIGVDLTKITIQWQIQ
ncbi:MAG TPA: Ig-like domain-containing protein [Patescibacteria group bacterium]|nr:Ig-like domain-containing protein [Patescibacteria group bacterium]